jgi:hypothetical protein
LLFLLLCKPNFAELERKWRKRVQCVRRMIIVIVILVAADLISLPPTSPNVSHVALVVNGFGSLNPSSGIATAYATVWAYTS